MSRGSEAERIENEANKELRLKVVNRQQMLWRAVDVEKLIEPEPRARAIWELVGRLDLRRFRAAIEVAAGEPGRPAYDPQLLISLWIYAYSEGVSSAREMERRCEYHPAYQWLTGLEGVNHHSLSDFRVAHQVALDELFTQVLGVLSSEGMIRLERVMHDGTKVKAAASGKSFRRQARLREHLEAARERVRQMGDPRQEALSAGKARRETRGPRAGGATRASLGRGAEGAGGGASPAAPVRATRERNGPGSAHHEAERWGLCPEPQPTTLDGCRAGSDCGSAGDALRG